MSSELIRKQPAMIERVTIHENATEQEVREMAKRFISSAALAVYSLCICIEWLKA